MISAVAELTPDRRDFIITYVVEEGERYKFADVKVESAIRDFKGENLTRLLPMKPGDCTTQADRGHGDSLNESAGLFGYAFATFAALQPEPENLTMGVTFQVAESPRVYVERIDISGNTTTRDKVIRREFRLAEGDPFNSVRVKRSRDRIQSLGFFQDDLEIEQVPGSAPDRVVLAVDVEEKSTGELQLSAGFSSLERFLLNASIRQRNFMGKGQELRAAVNYSSYSKSVELGFTEPYLFDRNIALGFDLYRRDPQLQLITTAATPPTSRPHWRPGPRRRAADRIYVDGVPLRVNLDNVTLDQSLFFSDPDGDAGPLPPACDPSSPAAICASDRKAHHLVDRLSLAYDTTTTG